MNATQIEKLNEIGKEIASEINKETGANVAVTIRKNMMVYTEDLEKIEEIRELVDQTAEYVRESFYEAEEDLPAGVTIFYNI